MKNLTGSQFLMIIGVVAFIVIASILKSPSSDLIGNGVTYRMAQAECVIYSFDKPVDENVLEGIEKYVSHVEFIDGRELMVFKKNNIQWDDCLPQMNELIRRNKTNLFLSLNAGM